MSVSKFYHSVINVGKRAIGVEYIRDGRLRQVYANKEVILSTGAIGPPQILILSGVGPKQHLEELGVSLPCEHFNLNFMIPCQVCLHSFIIISAFCRGGSSCWG